MCFGGELNFNANTFSLKKFKRDVEKLLNPNLAKTLFLGTTQVNRLSD